MLTTHQCNRGLLGAFQRSGTPPRTSGQHQRRTVGASAQQQATDQNHSQTDSCSRRQLLQLVPAAAALALGGLAGPASAVQGLTAGRLPGLDKREVDGFMTYTRPEGKSGGHGVGWSEIPRYSFKVPQGWQESPVSIADLGGTEIDLRFTNPEQGSLAVVVAPVLRFIDVGFNADIRIEELGSPEKLIGGFAPELFGSPLQDDDVISTDVTKKGELTHYRWELKPHRLVEATAYKNRVFLLALTANGRQWRKSEDKLKTIQQSFDILA
ncbi:g9711 [Coccomyxa viridis]|uniref:G9711 protein n=1 Tax=Coccomyxa viridis TaxID=1274662 RepID=A0ABP1G6B4_9CHLO